MIWSAQKTRIGHVPTRKTKPASAKRKQDVSGVKSTTWLGRAVEGMQQETSMYVQGNVNVCPENLRLADQKLFEYRIVCSWPEL